jgi:hypothetical protein
MGKMLGSRETRSLARLLRGLEEGVEEWKFTICPY